MSENHPKAPTSFAGLSLVEILKMKSLIAICVLFGLSEVQSLKLEVKPTKSGQLGVYDITDADGDGVQDNKVRTRDDLDMFYYPNVMGDAGNDVENTRHGGIPGNVNKEWLQNAMPEPEDTYTLVRGKKINHHVNDVDY